MDYELGKMLESIDMKLNFIIEKINEEEKKKGGGK